MMQEISSLEGFLEWEDAEGAHHEFIGGSVRPVPPDTIARNIIKGNVFAALRAGCRQKDCRVFMSTMRVVTPTGDALYPDIVIGPTDLPNETTSLVAPFAVVEIRSSDASRADRDRRLLAYQSIATLRRCVLIADDRRMVDICTRQEPDWTCETIAGPHAIISFGTIGVTLSLPDIYAGLDG